MIKEKKKRFKKIVTYEGLKDSDYFGMSFVAFFVFILGLASGNPNEMLGVANGLHWYNWLWFPIILFVMWIIVKLVVREVYWEEIK